MFMWGPAPIRRTIPYLKNGIFVAKDNVRVMEVHYSLHGPKYQTHEQMSQDFYHGLRQFYFWEMPRIQYLNPKLQIVRLLDKLPSPFIRFWLEDGSDIIIDCFQQEQQTILDRCVAVAGKSKERLKLEKSIKAELVGEDNPALFGFGKQRFCACEIPGQHPCPGVIVQSKFSNLETDFDPAKHKHYWSRIAKKKVAEN